MPKPSQSPQHLALGDTIRAARKERGWSQEAFALAAGLDRTYVSGVERGERNVSYANLLRLADTLGVPLSELIAQAEALGHR